MTLGIVKRDEFEFSQWLKQQHARASEMLERWGLDPTNLLDIELGWLLCLPKFQDRAMEFDLFQVSMLIQDSRFRAMLKARQIGFSFLIACESLARCHLKDRHVSVCVSYNLDDAKEKVALVKELHDELPLEFQKKIVIDSKTVVGFESRTSKRRISKVISNPAKAPRGKSGDVYLDELAHCQNDKEIYGGATALISRSGGQLTIGSSPMGQSGLFYEIYTDPKEYSGFSRQRVPWWLCSHFSTIANNPELIDLCSTLPTEVRVERYGTQALRDQFSALPIEDFRQEFECAFQDERVAFFPYHLIDPCCQVERDKIPVYDNIKMLAQVASKLGPLYLGFDVGRTKHPSELFVFEKQGDTYVDRFEMSLRDLPFPKQRRALFDVCDKLGQHWKKFRIDATGMGKNLAEDLIERYGRRVEQVTFTNAIKEDLANSAKIVFQEGNIILPRDRGIRAQIHSIKQKYTAHGNAIFDAERNRHHHADKFWAIALAIFHPKRKKRRVTPTVNVRMGSHDTGTKDLATEEARAPRRNLDPEQVGVVEAMFTLPGEAPPTIASGSQIVADALALRERYDSMTTEALEERGRSLATACQVYKRRKDEDSFRRTWNLYQRIRREVRRREAVRRATLRDPS